MTMEEFEDLTLEEVLSVFLCSFAVYKKLAPSMDEAVVLLTLSEETALDLFKEALSFDFNFGKETQTDEEKALLIMFTRYQDLQSKKHHEEIEKLYKHEYGEIHKSEEE